MTKNTKDLRLKPRWWQCIKAFLGGYFWSPCPMCGECFGGQEEPSGSLYCGMGSGKVVCANCAEEAEKLSDVVWKKEGVTAINGRKL